MHRKMKVNSTHVFQKGCFIHDPLDSFDIFDHYVHGRYKLSSFVIDEIIILNEKEWLSFISDLQKNQQYLKGKGGYNSTFLIPNEESFWKLEESVHDRFMAEVYRQCIAVVHSNDQLELNPDRACFVVDPQGLAYPKYVNPFGKWILPELMSGNP
ncbi:hypothetical protein SAMN05444392_11151 [Seinonella peptonophila]|uniref:Uncharacterized protein n=1 Tax=Seinonella peptonophila TaxID=112248 RepID=A0A1M4ZYR6_9BACL|nr:hypothetical protein [Seinonella peptonophila]SHF23111.1 hypothetical protein SAMN05444392_11151 [Seinonella peptonophila]